MRSELQNISIEESLESGFQAFLTGITDESEKELRIRAFQKFLTRGFPTKKEEEYKFTPIAPVVRKNFDHLSIGSDASVSPDLLNEHLYHEEGHHFVFFNGIYSEQCSRSVNDSGLEYKVIRDSTELNRIADGSDPFVSLNSALANGSLSIQIKRNKKALPVFIYHFVSSPDEQIITNPRLVIRAESGSESKILEKRVALESDNCLLNKIIEVDIRENASLNYTVIQDNASFLFETSGLKVRQAKDSRFYANVFSFRGQLIRNNIDVVLDDENCETHLHGLYLLNGKSHVDNHTSVDHKKPNSWSNEVYKGIVDEFSTGVFNGKIYVRPDAQNTNAFQSNNNINLSDTATIHTKPQLEIWADDVKCSHGCTIGQLDQEAIFYLRSRGLDKQSAKAMLLIAFAEESFRYVPFDFVKEELDVIINNRLGV